MRELFNAKERLERGSQGGTAVSRFEGRPVWAFQMEELLALVGPLKGRECVQSGTKKNTDFSHVSSVGVKD